MTIYSQKYLKSTKTLHFEGFYRLWHEPELQLSARAEIATFIAKTLKKGVKYHIIGILRPTF